MSRESQSLYPHMAKPSPPDLSFARVRDLEKRLARIAAILGPKLKRKMDYLEQQRLDNPAFMNNAIAEIPITYADVRELTALLGEGT